MTKHPIATEVIYEDEDIRVWNQIVKEGDAIPRHVHENDYFLVTVRGDGPLDVTFYNGTGGVLGDGVVLDPKRGDAMFIPKGHEEVAVNKGKEFRAVLVELLKDD